MTLNKKNEKKKRRRSNHDTTHDFKKGSGYYAVLESTAYLRAVVFSTGIHMGNTASFYFFVFFFFFSLSLDILDLWETFTSYQLPSLDLSGGTKNERLIFTCFL